MSETTTTTTDDPPKVEPKLTAPLAKEPEQFSREYVQELREENKTWRHKAQGHETTASQAKADAAKAKADADKAMADTRAAADQRIVRAELKAHALKAGMVDLDALKLFDLASVKLGEDGEIVIPSGLIEQWKKDKPYVFGATSTSSTAGKPKEEAPKPKHARDLKDEEVDASLLKEFGVRL